MVGLCGTQRRRIALLGSGGHVRHIPYKREQSLALATHGWQHASALHPFQMHACWSASGVYAKEANVAPNSITDDMKQMTSDTLSFCTLAECKQPRSLSTQRESCTCGPHRLSLRSLPMVQCFFMTGSMTVSSTMRIACGRVSSTH